jgi:hypothetical protein
MNVSSVSWSRGQHNAVTHQIGPFPCPYHTVLHGGRVYGDQTRGMTSDRPGRGPAARGGYVTSRPFLRTLAEADLPAFDAMLECTAKEQPLLRLVAALEGRG